MNVGGGGGSLPGIAPLPCPRGIFGAPGPISDGPPVPSTLSRSLGPMAYSGRLSGARGILYSILTFQQPRSQPVNELLHPSKRLCAFSQHQQQNDLLLLNLTNPLINITLTPGSLGWDSLLPPIIHSHHAFPIHSTHALGPVDPHSLIVHISFLFF